MLKLPHFGRAAFNTTTLSQRGENSKWLHKTGLLCVLVVGSNQIGYITAAFSRPQKWGGIEMARFPPPSWQPKMGRNQNGYITSLFEVPKMGRRQSGCNAFSGSLNWQTIMTPYQMAFENPQYWGKSNWLHNRYPLTFATMGEIKVCTLNQT